MKIKSVASSVVLVILSTLIISVVPAQAGECSVEDPCHTYAMVDDSGKVVNIIVCQPSVCGGGTVAGMKVVPQKAADASTGQNTGGWNSGPNVEVRESSGSFTIQDNSANSSTLITPEFNSNQTQLETFTAVSIAVDGDSSLILAKEQTKTSFVEESLSYKTKQTEAKILNDIESKDLRIIKRNWGWLRSKMNFIFI
jgi:hypothetical protein